MRIANDMPYGGYEQSGNGRECGVFGFEEFLETKAMLGWGASQDPRGLPAPGRLDRRIGGVPPRRSRAY